MKPNVFFCDDDVFDSSGRMWEMTYPDSEKLAYYNGGLLKAAWGEKYNGVIHLLRPGNVA